MNSPSTPSGRLLLRRANPIAMIAVGLLAGAMLAGVAQDARSPDEQVFTGSTDRPGGAGVPAGASELRTAPTGVGSGDGTASENGADAAGGDADAGSTSGTSGAPSADATSGGGGVDPGDPAAQQRCGSTPSSGVRGVTDTTVKIGFAIPDIGAFGTVFGEQIALGDIKGHYEAHLEGMRRDGILPVCGRDIEAVYREYSVIDPSAARSVCVSLIDEEQVFAVVAMFNFLAPECIAEEKQTPLVIQSTTEAKLARSPLMFAQEIPIQVAWRNTVTWLVKSGLADGETIGVYYNRQAHLEGSTTERDVVGTLKRLGHEPAVVVTSDTDPSVAGASADPNDSIAIQRFRAAGVTLAIPVHPTPNFYRQASQQRFRAQWVHQANSAADSTTSNYPPETLDGAVGALYTRLSEEKADLPLSPRQEVCYGYWTSATGKEPPPRDWGSGQAIRSTCDNLDVVTRALTSAGKDLTHPSFVRGLESIRDAPMAYYADITYGPDKRFGGASFTTNRYSKDCACWRASGQWMPIDPDAMRTPR